VLVKFEGYSDDTFGAYWKGGDVDHDDYASGSIRVMRVRAGGEEMFVTGIYAPGNLAATWAIGIAPIEDYQVMPSWPMTWRFERYSAVLELELPEGFEITLVCPAGGQD